MMPPFAWPGAWPEPADGERAARLAEQLKPRPGHPEDAALIACLGGNSPYLSALAVRESTCFAQLLQDGPAEILQAAIHALAGFDAATPRPVLAASLRRAKRQVALACAVADIGGVWDLDQVTGALTRLAEAALGASVRHLLQTAAARRELVLRDPARPEIGCGFVVLGMGKLGARELNYSSDIDLMLLYDPAMHPGHDDLRRVFTRIGGELITLMQARDADGYVFRTDLRLRPDPSSTPLAVSLPAALTYYESLGQTWERAALIKARPVAGDLACGQDFLEAIRPFVWRRHLDFAAIEDIRTMKRRIDRHKSGTAAAFGSPDADATRQLLGHDVKLGYGGIREIEFMAQTMQLVWGGRHPVLRDATTLGALSRLTEGNYLASGLTAGLATTYQLLRRTEHRLQMQDDRQTHSLPERREAFDAFARFMGEASGAALAAALLVPMLRTRASFEDLLAEHRGAEADAPRIDLAADDLEAQLTALAFPDPARAAGILATWHSQRLRALRSDRAQALLREILPTLLAAIGEQHDPILTLGRFDTLLARQGAGVQLLSLFARNPPLIDRIAAVLSAAPFLADHLAAVPAALEGLLIPDSDGDAQALIHHLIDAQIRAAGSLEEAIRRARTLVRGEEFRLSLAQMDGRLDVDQAGIARTALADRVIARMLEQVRRDHRARFGVVAGGGMVVVALGKAGSREMMAGSDLDLMLIYDHPHDTAESVLESPGPASRDAGAAGGRRRSLPVSQYYIRLAHSLIAALSAPGAGGPLYALDMRLRPSGNKGPVAVSLEAFIRYHAERSWTWERMALSRARVVAGPPLLRGRVSRAIKAALDRPGLAPEALLRSACAMRARVAAELPPRGEWDVKLLDGGLMEVEFIAQILQLACGDAALRHPTTRIALERLAQGQALDRTDADLLIAADRFWRAIQSMLRILFGTRPFATGTISPGAGGAFSENGKAFPRDELRPISPPALDALLNAVAKASLPGGRTRGRRIAGPGMAGPDGLTGLEDRMRQMSRAVREAFIRLIGEPRLDGDGEAQADALSAILPG